MKKRYFAEFYTLSTGYIGGTIPPEFSASNKKPIPVCGDRGTIVIDGRLSSQRMNALAADECKRRGYIGYKLHYGTFSNPARSLPYQSVQNKTNLQTISEATK